MTTQSASAQSWARLRFAIVGPLLASPPEPGMLQAELERLAGKDYRHPGTGRPVRFAASTLERWYYKARNHPENPLAALMRKRPEHAGTHPSLSSALQQALRAQHQAHPSWSYQLHYDNLLALARNKPELGRVPSRSTIVRHMKQSGLDKQRRKRRNRDARGVVREEREKRSYEIEHVHGLWHSDFHQGPRHVLTQAGMWQPCYLLAFLDDRSRLCCHLQWYRAQTAETFTHGLTQAIFKRGLPRALMTDNGSAMVAVETTEGLARLGIVHQTTLPYTPETNAKAEAFWNRVDNRLLPMLDAEKVLTLALLNRASQAWVELEYHHNLHSELAATPLEVAQSAPSVVRPSPDMQSLRQAFRTQETRSQRSSDGTISVGGIRFEIPNRYRDLRRPTVRFARWDLSCIDLVDARTGAILCSLHPLDKRRNADGRRRVIDNPFEREPSIEHEPTSRPAGIAPHLQQLMQDYAATGLPPAYLPMTVKSTPSPEENDS
jgi:putative transposase